MAFAPLLTCKCTSVTQNISNVLLNLHINVKVGPKIYPNKPLETCILM